MNKLPKMTPQEFWASIQTAASLNIARFQLQHHLELSVQNELQVEVSKLSSLVQELTGYPLYPSSGTEKSSSDAFHTGKDIELVMNGVPVAILKTEGAVAADYLLFLDGVLRALMLDKTRLESEARASGKTMQHDNFDALGAISVTNAKGL